MSSGSAITPRISYAQAFLIALCYQAVLVAVILAVVFFRHGEIPWDFLGYLLSAWDAGHYIYLAEHSYIDISQRPELIVFYPLYPILMSPLLRFMTPIQAGLLITSVSSVVGHALFLVYLQDLGFEAKRIARTFLLLCVSPIAVYFSLVYTEALYFAEAAAFLLLLRKNHLCAACVLGFFTALTRPVGLLLYIPFAFHVSNSLRGGSRIRWLILGFVIPSGYFVYLGLNDALFGDPFYASKVMAKHWYKELLNPISGYMRTVWRVLITGKEIGSSTVTIDHLFGLLAPLVMGLHLVSWRRNREGIDAGLVAWAWAQLLIIISVSWWLSTARYLCTIIPLYLMLERLASRVRGGIWMLALFFLSIALVAIYRFAGPEWVF
jgi:hypothetical protein